jgi:catechol 2,3-dioxygenase-like lactoylglutathione lyase family enzyme
MPHRYAGRQDTELAVVLDCSDLDRAGAFWCAALGYTEDRPASDRYLSLRPARGDGIELLLQRVPEVKARKNRMHLDLRAPDMEAEVERLLALGARRVTASPIEEEGWRWHVLEDPDGNELCVLAPPAPDGA